MEEGIMLLAIHTTFMSITMKYLKKKRQWKKPKRKGEKVQQKLKNLIQIKNWKN